MSRLKSFHPAVVAFVAVNLILYVLRGVFNWGGAHWGTFVSDLSFVPIYTLAIVVCMRAAARSQPGSRRIAWSWRLIGGALISYWAGNLLQAYYEFPGSTLPFPSATDALYLAFYPLFFAGLLCFPTASMRGLRRQLALDGAIVTLGGAGILWYFVLGPTVTGLGHSSVLNALVTVAYPCGDLILIVGLVYLLLSGGDRRSHLPLRLLAAGMAFYVLSDSAYAWQQANTAYAGGSITDYGYFVATCLFVFAASAQTVPKATRLEAVRLLRGWSVALSYVAVAAVLALMVYEEVDKPFFPDLSMAVLGGTLAGLLVIRLNFTRRLLLRTNDELDVARAELEAIAVTDGLTGLPNYRSLTATIDTEIERSARYGRGLSVLFLDLDHFKDVNDVHGHEAGDLALRTLGSLASETLRATDVPGRWGGEEFVAVLPETTAIEAGLLAERLRLAVAERDFGAPGGLTVSIGVASYPADGETRDALISAADSAMYVAKRQGRNRVVCASDPEVVNAAPANRDAVVLVGAADALAAVIESWSPNAGAHADAVAALAARISRELGGNAVQQRLVYLAGRVHDIGKIGVDPATLEKPGPLSADEWDEIRRHPVHSADIVGRVAQLRDVAHVVRGHHEHYDGAGYPDGLVGNAIPLEARILAVADAFDAMTRGRPYEEATSSALARAELRRCAGTQFDPRVVNALERLEPVAQEEMVPVPAHGEKIRVPSRIRQ